jgi:hypothetical protein
MLPVRKTDRYAPSPKGLDEARLIRQSFGFMKRRDHLLDICGKLSIALPAARVRLYEFIDYGVSGPLFRGVAEVGGMYANFNRLELPVAADWYSRHTLNCRRHGEPVLYPKSAPQPPPPRYAPWAFWHSDTPQEWIDILLMDHNQVVGKLSADNFRHPEKTVPERTGDCRTLFDELVRTMRGEEKDVSASAMIETHRRRILLNDLSDILQNMVATLGLDRARAYEFDLAADQFQARSEVGGTQNPLFTSLDAPYHLSREREDPVSFFTYEERRVRVFKRGTMEDYQGPQDRKSVV